MRFFFSLERAKFVELLTKERFTLSSREYLIISKGFSAIVPPVVGAVRRRNNGQRCVLDQYPVPTRNIEKLSSSE